MILEYNLQWFAKDGEGGEKTEPATAKKLNDAREEGKVAKSKELTSAFDLVVLFLVLKFFVSFDAEGKEKTYENQFKAGVDICIVHSNVNYIITLYCGN